MSDNLSTFLLQRIAEDEAVARAATAGPWRHNPGKEWHTDEAMLRRAREGRITFDGEEFVGAGPLDETICVAATGSADDPQSMADADHIARHDPARVLAKCAADRLIVELATGAVCRLANRVADEWGTFSDTDADEDLLRLLALPYADHPDYAEATR